MKNKFLLVLGLLIIFGLGAHTAEAATPSLYITADGQSANITVYGDAHAQAYLYYYPTDANYPLLVKEIGRTNSQGRLTATVDNTTYPIPHQSATYVMVNGYKSGYVLWPVLANTTLTLSQHSITLTNDQTIAVTASHNIYIQSNSNPNVVTISAIYKNISLTGKNNGSATIRVCAIGSDSNCRNLYVTTNTEDKNAPPENGWSTQKITLQEPQTRSIYLGQYTSSHFYLYKNTNVSVATATIKNNTLKIVARNAGFTRITTCLTGKYSTCRSFEVTVKEKEIISNKFSVDKTNITFYGLNQTQIVKLNCSGQGYLALDTDSAVASSDIRGNILYIGSRSNGKADITVCNPTRTECAIVHVTVATK